MRAYSVPSAAPGGQREFTQQQEALGSYDYQVRIFCRLCACMVPYIIHMYTEVRCTHRGQLITGLESLGSLGPSPPSVGLSWWQRTQASMCRAPQRPIAPASWRLPSLWVTSLLILDRELHPIPLHAPLLRRPTSLSLGLGLLLLCAMVNRSPCPHLPPHPFLCLHWRPWWTRHRATMLWTIHSAFLCLWNYWRDAWAS